MRHGSTQTLQLEKSVSPFARECLKRIALPERAHVLDIPCGFGRHSAWLASTGHRITAIDIDAERVAATERAATALSEKHSIRGIVADANKPMPLPPNSFDLAIVVHYYAPTIFETVIRVIKPGGYLIFETFGAQGYNWQALPETGMAEKLLCRHFEMQTFRERGCGPKNANAVVHTLAQKRF